MSVSRSASPAAKLVVLGPLTLQNEFLLYVVRKELGVACSLFDRDLNTFSLAEDDGPDGPRLLLIDAEDQMLEEVLRIVSVNQDLASSCLALFNLSGNAGMEPSALAKNIRGFFYKEDKFEIFLKGVRALLKGEVWISREILLQCVFDGINEKRTIIAEKAALTNREIEILSLVSMGSTNEELAAKIFISTNTVKTHLYNIFKKINVENRLQAALWAASNL